MDYLIGKLSKTPKAKNGEGKMKAFQKLKKQFKKKKTEPKIQEEPAYEMKEMTVEDAKQEEKHL